MGYIVYDATNSWGDTFGGFVASFILLFFAYGILSDTVFKGISNGSSKNQLIQGLKRILALVVSFTIHGFFFGGIPMLLLYIVASASESSVRDLSTWAIWTFTVIGLIAGAYLAVQFHKTELYRRMNEWFDNPPGTQL